MAYCVNCGMELKDDVKFCTNCGAPQMQPPTAGSFGQNGAGSSGSFQGGPGQNEPGQMQQTGSFVLEPSAPVQQGQTSDPFGQPQYDTQGTYTYGQTADSSSSAADSQTAGDAFFHADDQTAGSAAFAGDSQTAGSASSYAAGGQTASGAAYGAAGGAGTVDYANPVPGMNFMEAVATCFSKYVTFSGRARRSEFWYFTLFVFVVNLLLGWVGNMILGVPDGGGPNKIQGLFSLVILLPTMAVFWRRMHDIGKSGLWYLLNLIPIAGTLILIAFEIRDSAPGENQYGMSPKYPVQ